MIHFFGDPSSKVVAVAAAHALSQETLEKLHWLLGDAPQLSAEEIKGLFMAQELR